MSRQSQVFYGFIQDTKGCTLEMASGSLAYNEIATAAGCTRDVWPERERDWEDTQAFYTGQPRPEQGYLSVGWTGLDNIKSFRGRTSVLLEWVRTTNQSDDICGCGWSGNYDSLMQREPTDDRDPGRVRDINSSILCGLISTLFRLIILFMESLCQSSTNRNPTVCLSISLHILIKFIICLSSIRSPIQWPHWCPKILQSGFQKEIGLQLCCLSRL